jgi:hypothetical protein
MGVPITFLDKYNPDQFKILSMGSFKLGGRKTYKRILIRRRKAKRHSVAKTHIPMKSSRLIRAERKALMKLQVAGVPIEDAMKRVYGYYMFADNEKSAA